MFAEQFAERPEVRTNWNDQVFSVVRQHVETGDVSGFIEDPCQVSGWSLGGRGALQLDSVR